MAQFDVMVKLVVEADDETDAFLRVESAKWDLFTGNGIQDADVQSVDERVAQAA